MYQFDTPFNTSRFDFIERGHGYDYAIDCFIGVQGPHQRRSAFFSLSIKPACQEIFSETMLFLAEGEKKFESVYVKRRRFAGAWRVSVLRSLHFQVCK